ncbi:uncharacterized protein EAF01_001158 [Botrytis porri]|uniref:uncharacterized protein n=1 Tax=Botrytis porri TaxID=87229 RepID=UPI0019006EC5|nr:uncharacterized protein EAF01_001158 [Botrytis porri]KAF7912137.1 hypothetical protein EAF01_001158 [Botrytis porri]
MADRNIAGRNLLSVRNKVDSLPYEDLEKVKLHLDQKSLELTKPTIWMRKRRARNECREIRENIPQRRVKY